MSLTASIVPVWTRTQVVSLLACLGAILAAVLALSGGGVELPDDRTWCVESIIFDDSLYVIQDTIQHRVVDSVYEAVVSRRVAPDPYQISSGWDLSIFNDSVILGLVQQGPTRRETCPLKGTCTVQLPPCMVAVQDSSLTYLNEVFRGVIFDAID